MPLPEGGSSRVRDLARHGRDGPATRCWSCRTDSDWLVKTWEITSTPTSHDHRPSGTPVSLLFGLAVRISLHCGSAECAQPQVLACKITEIKIRFAYLYSLIEIVYVLASGREERVSDIIRAQVWLHRASPRLPFHPSLPWEAVISIGIRLHILILPQLCVNLRVHAKSGPLKSCVATQGHLSLPWPWSATDDTSYMGAGAFISL